MLLVVSSSVATFVGNGKSGEERVDVGDITAKVSNILRVIIVALFVMMYIWYNKAIANVLFWSVF